MARYKVKTIQEALAAGWTFEDNRLSKGNRRISVSNTSLWGETFEPETERPDSDGDLKDSDCGDFIPAELCTKILVAAKFKTDDGETDIEVLDDGSVMAGCSTIKAPVANLIAQAILNPPKRRATRTRRTRRRRS